MTQYIVYQCPLCHNRVDYDEDFGPHTAYCEKNDKYVTMEYVGILRGWRWLTHRVSLALLWLLRRV